MAKKPFRMLATDLVQEKRFVDITPAAKATYLVLRLVLPTYGLGRCITKTLPTLVGCSEAELASALAELEQANLVKHDPDRDIFLIEAPGQNWRSQSFFDFVLNELEDLPKSPLTEEFSDGVIDRLRTVSEEREKKKERETQLKQMRKVEENESDTKQ